jgi:hypothetical protein
MSDDASLAAARPREDQKRTFHVRGRQTLRLIEVVELHAFLIDPAAAVNPGGMRSLGGERWMPTGR